MNWMLAFCYIVMVPGILVPMFLWLMRRELILQEATRLLKRTQDNEKAKAIKERCDDERQLNAREGFFGYTAVFALGERILISGIVAGVKLQEATDEIAFSVLAGWVGLKFAAGWNDGKRVKRKDGTFMDVNRLRQERHLSLMCSIWSMVYCYAGADYLFHAFKG